MDRLQPDAGLRDWVREQDTEGNVVDIDEEIGQMVTEVKIAQRTLSDFWRGIHAKA